MSVSEEMQEVLPVSVLLLRSPIPTSKGTDPYHDAFGSFCLPSFATSALESGTSTPLPDTTQPDQDSLELIKSALSQSGRRKGRFIEDQPRLMTHHLSYPTDDIDIEYCVTSFPILTHTLLNIETLADRLLHAYPSNQGGERIPYRGMVVTSQRAVDAYIEAARHAQDTLRAAGKNSSASPTAWSRVPFFTVGPATSSALRSLPLQPWLRPRLVMGGQATGTAELLATYIVRHFSTPSLMEGIPAHAPLLYLVGDKNTSTIPDALDAANPPIPHEQVQVYETRLDPHFQESVQTLAKSLPVVLSRPVSRRPSQSSIRSRPGSRRPSGGSVGARMPDIQPSSTIVPDTSLRPEPESITPIEEETILKALRSKQQASSSSVNASPKDKSTPLAAAKPDWIVFFSPSGVNYALAEFRQRKWLPPAPSDSTAPASKTKTPFPKIAVIGPTTRDWIVENLGIEPHAVAAKPGPKELKDAIEAVEVQKRGRS